MSNMTYLLLANIAVWGGIAAYVAFLHAGSARMEKRLAILEMTREDDNG